VHCQRSNEAVRPWPALYARPASTGEACTLEIKVMILKTLMRARPGN
jgi:hypothetical protein